MSPLSTVCKRFIGLLVVAEVVILCIQIIGVNDDQHVSRWKDFKRNHGKSFKKLQRMNHFININISDRHRAARDTRNATTRQVTQQPAQPTHSLVFNENGTGNLSIVDTYIEFEPREGWNNDNNTYLSCQDISQISLIDALGRGTTKEAFLGRLNGEGVCVKMVTSAVTDIRSCKHRQLASEEQCNMLANYKLVKEIGLLLQLKHQSIIKMRGFCIRSEAVTGKLADHGVVTVTELGNKVTPHRLKGMTWQSRLQLKQVSFAALVVSPLVALSVAQSEKLRSHGINASVIREYTDPAIKRDILKGKATIIFASPEALFRENWLRLIASSYAERLCVQVYDEAHCISEWGNDFRPDFKRVCNFRSHLNCPALALTATMTMKIKRDVFNTLCFDDDTIIVSAIPDRPDVFLAGGKASCRFQQELQWVIDNLKENGVEAIKIIIYTNNILSCSKIFKWMSASLKSDAFIIDNEVLVK